MIGLAAAGLQMAKGVSTNPGARVALCAAHTVVSAYLTHYSVKCTVESVKDTKDATVTAAQSVRPAFVAAQAKVKNLRHRTDTIPNFDTSQTRQPVS